MVVRDTKERKRKREETFLKMSTIMFRLVRPVPNVSKRERKRGRKRGEREREREREEKEKEREKRVFV